MPNKERWITCPQCGNGKLLKILETTQGTDIPVYCKRCRKHVLVNIDLQ